MADLWHVKWLKEGVDKWNKRRKKVKFAPDLSGLKFYDLLPPDFRDSPKTSRYFERIDLSQSNLSNADLSDLNFTNANFTQANLSHADLSMSNFSKAIFVDTNLSDSNLERSIFNSAKFQKSNLEGATFFAANTQNATFIECSISDSQRESMDKNSYKNFPTIASYGYHRKIEKDTFSTTRAPSIALEEDLKTKKNRHDVFFGTNRNPIFERGTLTGFGSDRAKEVSYGICEVVVPDTKKIGSMGPPWWKKIVSKSDDHLRLGATIALNDELFWNHIKEASLKFKKSNRPTIFVHGFNNTFEYAVLRAAQMGHDLGLGQGIGLFSWPSKGNLRSYSADEASAEVSKYPLADFITNFTENSNNVPINIIAHSMGCRCLMLALEVLSGSQPSILGRIGQVILAAADVDTGIMPQLGRHAVQHCKRTTSYVSDQDKPLIVSGWLHSYPRVGVTPPTFTLDGMDTVLVNDFDLGQFSHGYVASSRSVLADIFQLLKHNAAPSERFGIESASDGIINFWRIKE